MVWMRGRVAAEECPKSLVTPESVAQVERFFVRKHFGAAVGEVMSARDADAFLALQQELQRELANGQVQ